MSNPSPRLALAIAAALALALCVAGCDQAPRDFDDFLGLDAQDKPIVCADFVATYDTYADSQPRVSDESVKPLLLAAAERGFTVKQCHAEIEAERHARCGEYAGRVKAAITLQRPNDDSLTTPLWFVRGHLPEDFTSACAAEVRAAVAGVNDEFRTDRRGPNPILELTRQSVAIPMISVTRMSIDPRDAADSLWRIDIEASDGGYSLWFSSSAKASSAYDALRAAWVQTRQPADPARRG
ncbi:hypothetical protein [Paraburkholderia youngii]|uniref:hypothetical protein n=1 Tax=Paraburkholderia youngii TaxID=2782701 RepID=UPI003D198C31